VTKTCTLHCTECAPDGRYRLFSNTYGAALDLRFVWSGGQQKEMILKLTLAMIMVAGASFAIDPPRNNRPANGQGQQQGQMKGKRGGPQDGSGPIHTPGTGGGTGAGTRGGGGQRGGRR
jgi:hypothetical protein